MKIKSFPIGYKTSKWSSQVAVHRIIRPQHQELKYFQMLSPSSGNQLITDFDWYSISFSTSLFIHIQKKATTANYLYIIRSLTLYSPGRLIHDPVMMALKGIFDISVLSFKTILLLSGVGKLASSIWRKNKTISSETLSFVEILNGKTKISCQFCRHLEI